MTFAAPVQHALEIHRAGRLAEAIPLYRTLLAERPEDADLRHLLALALAGIEPAAAQAELRRALVLAPATGLYLHNAVQLADPSDQNGLARLLTHALAVDPMRAVAQHSLGALDARAGQRASAARRFRRALALDPAFPPAIFDHSNIVTEARQLRLARTGYVRLLAVDPIHQSGLTSLGALLYRLGFWLEAEAVFTRLLRCAPENADAMAALGAVRAERGDVTGATGSVHSALALDPTSANTWQTFATILLKDPTANEAALRAATRASWLAPAMTEPHTTRSIVLFHQGRAHDAIAARRAALACSPDDAQAHYEFLPFLHLDPNLSPAEQLAFRRDVHARFSEPLGRLAVAHSNDPNPDRRLNIAYVDNQMLYRSTHSMTLLPLVEAHDPTEVALYFYTNLPETAADDATRRYAAVADGFRYTGGLTDAEVVQLVRDDGVDILIDVSGHLTGTRAGVFTRKPAPIQVALFQVGSSGLTQMDYAVADTVLLPPGQPAYFSEKILYVPTGYAFQPVADMTPPIGEPPDGRPPTFGSFNLLVKLNDRVLALWIRVLAAVPGSRLLLKATGLACPATRRRIADVFAENGIAPERLDLRAWTSGYAGHLATFDEIDIALDPFPYPGITTTLEALLMGVPVVTMAGDRYIGRYGEALLRPAGHPEWIARNEDDYVAIARRLALNPAERRMLRQRLRDELLASPLGDATGFTRAFESGLRSAWRGWCARHRQEEV